MLVLGISAKKRAGKDTLYQILKDEFGDIVQRVAFADVLKDEACETFLQPLGVERSVFEGESKEYFRPILQWLGTFRRDFTDPNYWVTRVKDRLSDPFYADKVVCITDVRFINEVNFVSSEYGLRIRVNSTRVNSEDKHPSEIALDDYKLWDYIFDNDGTIEQYTHDVLKRLGPIVRNI